jgi:tRNA(adenine34) deaminase
MRPGARSDADFMREALALARLAEQAAEVPVGALLVLDGQIVASGWNRPIATHDPTAHAEIVTLRAAGAQKRNYRLESATLYVTLEPCAMCTGALLNARVARVVFGAWDPKAGACGSLFDLPRDPRVSHRLDVFGGVLSDECGALLTNFFAARRS